MASKVLVTGGTGLLGSYLNSSESIEYIKSPTTLNFFEHNSFRELLRMAKTRACSKILHLAWCSNSNLNYEQDKSNFNWAEKTIEFAKISLKNGFSFITVGTGNEDDPENKSPYTESKRLVRRELFDQINESNLSIIKLFYVVDIAKKRPRIIAGLTDNRISQQFSVKYGSSGQDYIFSQDVITGLSSIISHNLNGEIELGSGFLTSNRRLIEFVCSQINSPLPLIENNFKKNGNIADIKKLSNLGWSPSVTQERIG